jgi:hypothetical protein
MTRTFCDRCARDITTEKSGRVEGVEDADVEGQGATTELADLCERCYLAFRAWLQITVPNHHSSGDTGE